MRNTYRLTVSIAREFTACSVVQIQPNKLLGVVGEHEHFPIERIALNRDNTLLGSCSHDMTVKFWNVGYLFEDSGTLEEIEAAGGGEDLPDAGGDEEEGGKEGDDDSDSSSEEAKQQRPAPKKSRNKPGKGNFFADL